MGLAIDFLKMSRYSESSFLNIFLAYEKYERILLTCRVGSYKVGFMQQEPVFILAQNYNYGLTLKAWLANPAVFFTMFIWIMGTIVCVKNRDTKPFKWILVLTIFLVIFRILPLNSHPIPMTQEQTTQVATQMANAAAPLPPVVTPVATVTPTPTVNPTPKETPSAQMINN